MDARRTLAGIAILVAPVLLAGCFLRSLLGHTFTEGLGESIDAEITAIRAGSTTGVCLQGFFAIQTTIDCTYFIGGEPVTSSGRLISEFGLFGVVVDPVILQVPANARGFAATFSGAASGTLAITELVGGFDADDRTHVDPEPGHKFVVLDFPEGVSPGAQDYSFELIFSRTATPSTPPPLAVKATQLQVKAMFAGRVVARGKTFYPPLLPCVTSFTAIPAMTIPVAGAPQPISVPATGLQGCNNKVYVFNPSALATSEVVEYYHAGLDHYFITGLASEVAALDAGTQIRGWTRTGRTFKAYAAAEAGSSPVCRYYLPPAFGDSHFYGRGTAECNATGQQHPGFVLESSAFMHMRLPDSGACAPGTIPVYRVFSNRADANHRYMTDRALRDQMVAAGWVAEGDGFDRVVMCAPT